MFPSIISDLSSEFNIKLTYPVEVEHLNRFYASVSAQDKEKLISSFHSFLKSNGNVIEKKDLFVLRLLLSSYLSFEQLNDLYAEKNEENVFYRIKTKSGDVLHIKNEEMLRQYKLHNFEEDYEVIKDHYDYTWLAGVDPSTRLLRFLDSRRVLRDALKDDLVYENVAFGFGKTAAHAREAALQNLDTTTPSGKYSKHPSKVFDFQVSSTEDLMYSLLLMCREEVRPSLQELIDNHTFIID